MNRLVIVAWWVLVLIVVASGGLLAPLLLVGLAWKNRPDQVHRPEWLKWLW